MDRIGWQRIYREQCYMPVAKQYLEQVLLKITENADKIHRELNGQVDAFFQSLCMLQENGKLDPIRTVSISFPYTSLVCGNPYLLFEVYPDYPFMDDARVVREFPVSWLFSEWETFWEQLDHEAGAQGLSSVIRMPYIRSDTWGTARMILRMMSTIVKYHLYGLEKMYSYTILKKTDDFTLYFGEYIDWQRTLFAIKEDMDIFQCEEGTDMCFCHFRGTWYENKVFEQLNLDDCQFHNATFRNCRFSETSFRDTRFFGCTFTGSSFSGAKLNGARFDGCKFEDVDMRDIHTNSFSEEVSFQLGMQGMTEFIGCHFQNFSLENCDFLASYFHSCRIKEAQTKESKLPNSFNDCLT